MITDKKALERYDALKLRVRQSTPLPVNESPKAKADRIALLLSDFSKFCKYYFPQYLDPKNGGAEFGWFHKRAAKKIVADPNIYAILEWPREHAKSVFGDIFIPMFLKAKGEVTGVVIASATDDKAAGLLGDLQAELESNQRYINDFGIQHNFGSWADGHFKTRDGVGFWSIGKGGNPRGIREAEKRPNLLIYDDFDDDKRCRNPKLVDIDFDWLNGALIGAMALLQARIIGMGNRIAKYSVLSKVVGDIEKDDKVNEGVTHIKVWALENPKTHKEDQSERGVPAWKERYKRDHIIRRSRVMGRRMSQREFFHKQIQDGNTFKRKWFVLAEMPKIRDFDAIVTYNDPSFKDTSSNDYKAIVALGKIGNKYWLIDCWVRQASRKAMVVAHYDMAERIEEGNPKILKNYIEANFTQDSLIEDYVTESDSPTRGYMMAIMADLRGKPNKQGRIENMTPTFERGLFYVNRKLKNSSDYQTLKDQFMEFPNGHDDAPDATEGAMWQLRTVTRTNKPMKTGPRERRNQM